MEEEGEGGLGEGVQTDGGSTGHMWPTSKKLCPWVKTWFGPSRICSPRSENEIVPSTIWPKQELAQVELAQLEHSRFLGVCFLRFL